MINRIELLPVKENKLVKDKTQKWISFRTIWLDIYPSKLVLMLLAAFISRASIMEGLRPFGIALVAAYLGRFGASIVVPVFTSMGLLTTQGSESFQYIGVIWFVYLAYCLFKNKIKLSTMLISVIASLALLTVRLINILTTDIFIYDIFMSIFETVIIFTLTYIFTYSLPFIKNSRSRVFTNEEIICGGIMLSLAISGASNIAIWGLSLNVIIGALIVIMFAYNKGPALGTTVGVTIGMITTMSSINMPVVIAVYGFSGLLSGLFRDLGKIGSSAGFFIGNGIISFYISGLPNTIIGYKETAVAVVLFLIFSKKLTKVNNSVVTSISNASANDNSYSKRLKDITFRRLSEISKVFEELGATFKRVADKEKIVEQIDISKYANDVVENVCQSCSMNKFCWEKDFYQAYHSMFDIMSIIELNGQINKETLPEYFKKRCIKTEQIVNQCNYLFDIYKINYRWENKILESRQLVSEQLEGVSDIIRNLADEIYNDVKFKVDVEKSIYAGLRNNGIDVYDVVVTESNNDNFEIYVELEGNKKDDKDISDIISVVSDIVGFQLAREKYSYSVPNKDNRILFKLIKANRYGALTKVSRAGESFNLVSGDSYTFGERHNEYYLALSDGMGVGQKANQESNITITLLEKFLEAGFNKELALKTINSILVLKSTEEIFATIDMSMIDLCSGKLQFIKIGAAPTFIKKKDGVEVIKSHSLPAGILKDVDFQIYETYVEDGDQIIMMSDGVLDGNDSVSDKEEWMKNVIQSINSFNPQTIANEIINIGSKAWQSEDKDDMTVLVTKIWKRR